MYCKKCLLVVPSGSEAPSVYCKEIAANGEHKWEMVKPTIPDLSKYIDNLPPLPPIPAFKKKSQEKEGKKTNQKDILKSFITQFSTDEQKEHSVSSYLIVYCLRT